jgi:hypothetical protein
VGSSIGIFHYCTRFNDAFWQSPPLREKPFLVVTVGDCNGFFTSLYNMGFEGKLASDLLFLVTERKHLCISGHAG